MTAISIANMLGGEGALKIRVGSAQDLIRLTRRGIPADVFEQLAEQLDVDRLELARLAGVSPRTLSRRLSAGSRLTSDESDRTIRLARVLAFAKETLGDMPHVAQWLKTANAALGGVPPLQLLDTDAGVQSVENLLGRIAYGIYS